MNTESVDDEGNKDQLNDTTDRLETLAGEHSRLLSVIGSELSESSNAIESLSRNATGF